MELSVIAEDPQDCSLSALTERVSGTASPGSGAVAAITISLAAGLVAMAARRDAFPGSGGAAAQAIALRDRALQLSSENTAAFARARAALADPPVAVDGSRDFALGVALAEAGDVPLRIAEAATDVVLLAVYVHAHTDQATRPDVVAAAQLAEAATRAAAHLVDVNLVVVAGDARAAQARMLVRAGSAALERLVG